ncbi:MAG: hypothetical protein BMS9Abin01_2770 [Gammaproteobacteria bacterium]|nr:MAG: hypothetical protein BMS9Abin01_2770 [Gammaproteobacteria bacterium]
MRSLERLWKSAGCPAESLQHIDIEGSDPVLPSPFKIGEAAAATIGATALAAAELWRLRTGRAQQVQVDTRTAAMAFRSERHLRIDGAPPPALWDDIVAGPVAARALAAHGADGLQVSAPHLPSIDQLVIDTGFGKRATSTVGHPWPALVVARGKDKSDLYQVNSLKRR